MLRKLNRSSEKFERQFEDCSARRKFERSFQDCSARRIENSNKTTHSNTSSIRKSRLLTNRISPVEVGLEVFRRVVYSD